MSGDTTRTAPAPIVIVLNGTSIRWNYWGEGSFNRVYWTDQEIALVPGHPFTGPWVWRIPKPDAKGSLDDIDRVLRIWIEINPTLPAARFDHGERSKKATASKESASTQRSTPSLS